LDEGLNRRFDANAVTTDDQIPLQKFPDSLATEDTVTSRPVSVIVTFALGTAAPLESAIVPTMLP
jgi:hypothetical protein